MWPTNFLVVKPVLRSHRRRVLSHEDERANCPSDEMAMSETKWLWPWRIFLGKPKDESSRVSCQTMMVLSTGDCVVSSRLHSMNQALAMLRRALHDSHDLHDVPLEAVKIMSGFSDDVATAVIQFE